MSLIYFINVYVAKILPFFSLLLFIFQFFSNIYLYLDTEQTKNSIIFNITKYIYYFNYIMGLISFFMTYITEPGYVTEGTNEKFLYLYQKSRKYSLMKANIYNENHNLNKPIEGDNNDLYTDGSSSEDEFNFSESQYLTNLYYNCKRFKANLNFDVKQCRQCHIIKVCGTVHCSVCHKCVYMKDHHCIWFNQCIGQFNLKYFILFSFYLFLGSTISFSKSVYYLIYKNYIKLFSDFSFNKNIILITHVVFDLVYIIFSFKLLYDQYTNLDYFCIMYDIKRKKIIEIRTKYEMLCEDFGDEFGIGWLLPFKAGGFYGLIKNKQIIKTGSYGYEGNDKNKVKNY